MRIVKLIFAYKIIASLPVFIPVYRQKLIGEFGLKYTAKPLIFGCLSKDFTIKG
ncbi:MAG: hypothetical protein ACXWEY_01365 [Bacteroidia bacterium]